MIYNYTAGFNVTIVIPQDALDAGVTVDKEYIVNEGIHLFTDYLKSLFKDFELLDESYDEYSDEVGLIFESSEYVAPNQVSSRIFKDSDRYQFIVSDSYSYGPVRDFNYYEEPVRSEMKVDVDVIFQDRDEYSVTPINESLLDTSDYVKTSGLNKPMEVKKDTGSVEKGTEMSNVTTDKDLDNGVLNEAGYWENRPVRYKIYYNIHNNQVLEGGSNLLDEAEEFAKACIDRLASNPWEDKEDIIEAIDSIVVYDCLQEEDVTSSNVEKYANIAIENLKGLDEDCGNTLAEDVEEEIQDGDEIVYNGEHLFVINADYMDRGRWLWVTDEEEDRYNKKAPGWSLDKELVDEVIGQPDGEELDESWKDFAFIVKCNDGPKELVRVVADNKSQAEKYAKNMYAANHTTYADDRYNIWSIEETMSEGMDARTLSPVTKIDKECGVEAVEGLEKSTLGDMQIWAKKRQKGLPALSTLKTDAGNVEYNNAYFNHLTSTDGNSTVTESERGLDKDMNKKYPVNKALLTALEDDLAHLDSLTSDAYKLTELFKEVDLSYPSIRLLKDQIIPSAEDAEDAAQQVAEILKTVIEYRKSDEGKLETGHNYMEGKDEYGKLNEDIIKQDGKWVNKGKERYNKFKIMNESLASRYADSDAQKDSIKAIENTLNRLGIKAHYGTKIGKYPQTVILDIKYQDNAIYILSDGRVLINGDSEGKVNPKDKNAVKQMLIDYGFIEQPVNESISKNDRDIIIDAVKGEFETGHGYVEDKDEFEEMIGRRLTQSKYEELKDFYNELQDLGPEGFYEEYKDKLEFDPDFVSEYGHEEGEWEEVASKQVEDSDGFMTDYVWYTDGFKHVFVFGDSEIYRPEDGNFDWEIDVVEGKEAESYREAQEWFDSYNGFADDLGEKLKCEDLDLIDNPSLDEIWLEIEDAGGVESYKHDLDAEIKDNEKFLSYLKGLKDIVGTNFDNMDDVRDAIENTEKYLDRCRLRLSLVSKDKFLK